jgi:hypothetical protein
MLWKASGGVTTVTYIQDLLYFLLFLRRTPVDAVGMIRKLALGNYEPSYENIGEVNQLLVFFEDLSE